LLCSASDLDGLPYLLTPGDQVTDLATARQSRAAPSQWPAPTARPGPVVRASAELLAAIARPPRRELPGIRLVERAAFDVTPDHADDGTGIMLGAILDEADQPVGEFTVSSATLNRHVLITGATGSGKSQTTRHLLEQLHKQGVPWLVIEPAKAEYAGMAGRIGEDNLVVLHPGDPDAVPYGLNPLQPEPGFPLQTHIDLLRALFLAAFEPAEPFPQVLSQALDRCYRDLGWDPTISASRLPGITPRYPRLSELHQAALAVVEGVGYGKDVSDNVRGFVDVRLRSLRLGTSGRFFDGRYPLSVADLLRRNVVLEIEDVGEDSEKAFLMGALLIRIVEHLRVQHNDKPASGLRHVTVIEEAHRLLRRALPGSPTAHAVELFTALLAEIRAYGEGIVVAEQIPDKIVPDVIKNTALKIVHRLPGLDDREAVGATMNLEPAQSRHIVSLPPGRAVVFADGMDRPIRIAVPHGEAREATSGTPGPAIAVDRPGEVPLLTGRQLAATEHLADDPELVLWIELLAMAHIVGKPAPRPRRQWCEALLGREPREIVSHAVVHRIGAAIETRYAGLADCYQPEALGTHLAEVALRALHSDQSICDGSEVRWQAGAFRWVDVRRALKAFEGTGPHPATPHWAHRGLHLTGATRDEQLAQLRLHRGRIRADSTVVTGTQPFAWQRALEQLSTTTVDSRARWSDALRFLDTTIVWPMRIVTHPSMTPGEAR
jgi:DNA helicase HerA-like ATPase